MLVGVYSNFVLFCEWFFGVFIYLHWCPNLFTYQIMFGSFNNYLHDRQHYWSKNCLPRQATLLEQELLTTTGNTTGARTAYPSGTPDFTTGFSEVTVDNFFIFYVMFCQLLFFVLTIFFWSLYYLSVFNLQLIISPLVFSYFFSSTLFDILSTIFILYKCMFVECAM